MFVLFAWINKFEKILKQARLGLTKIIFYYL